MAEHNLVNVYVIDIAVNYIRCIGSTNVTVVNKDLSVKLKSLGLVLVVDKHLINLKPYGKPLADLELLVDVIIIRAVKTCANVYYSYISIVTALKGVELKTRQMGVGISLAV